MTKIPYGRSYPLEGASLDEAILKVETALGEVGFGVLTRIDVDTTLREKLGEEFRPYSILGACNPQLALKALRDEADIGLLMPCNVVVQGTETGVEVSAIDPRALVAFVGEGTEAAGVMLEAATLLERAMGGLTAGG